MHHEVLDQRVSVEVVVDAGDDGEHGADGEPSQGDGQVVARRARRASRYEVLEEPVACILPARACVDDAEASLRERRPRDLEEDDAEEFERAASSEQRAVADAIDALATQRGDCLLYTSPSPRDQRGSRMPSSA